MSSLHKLVKQKTRALDVSFGSGLAALFWSSQFFSASGLVSDRLVHFKSPEWIPAYLLPPLSSTSSSHLDTLLSQKSFCCSSAPIGGDGVRTSQKNRVRPGRRDLALQLNHATADFSCQHLRRNWAMENGMPG
ncbi:hypothetical protein GOP47_0025323 [Adiantum capillus-veneris]|uniref:Uncharacterized protein n=1 Tax=Adiantum capillus-veneris TaxID=13818 RepID=A0A9D4Z2W9_ADICA|nr:hypothetical protein GOP47_0025323 [Adiantum capillus-veneris]